MSKLAANGVAAHEMTRHQRGLVDTCFEEGQYEAGIAALRQLRSPFHNPSPPHIRQLLFIALSSPLSTERSTDKLATEPASPSKVAGRQAKPAYPSLAAILAAQNLLASFARTNSPDVLIRAVPSYDKPLNSKTELNDDADSFIAKQAKCILEAKCCWELLKEGFLDGCLSVSVASRHNEKGNNLFLPDYQSSEDSLSPVLIFDNAWPVFEWLLQVFEQDEIITEKSGSSRYSPLLLKQIPPPRGGAGLRWDSGATLDIVFFCLQHSEARRWLGARLLSLLLNLALTQHLDMQMFMMTVYRRAAICPEEQLFTLFSELQTTENTLKFKIALCQRFLSGFMLTTDGVNGTPRPKPQARAQGARSPVRRKSIPSTAATTVTKTSISCSQLVRLIEAELDSSNHDKSLAMIHRLKYELLLSYGTMQHLADEPDRDPEWSSLLKDGKVFNITRHVVGYETFLETEARRWSRRVGNTVE